MAITNNCERCNDAIEAGGRYKVRKGARGDTKLVYWCSDCTSSSTVKCGECNTRFSMEEESEHIIRFSTDRSRYSYCYYEDCYLDFIWFCANDGEPNPVAHRYCRSCQKDTDGNIQRCRCGGGSPSNPIHVYNCDPTLVFHGEDDDGLFMGFELETQVPSALITEAAVYAMNQLQTDEIAQLKNDGSIGGGFEIVTQPHTYQAYLSNTKLWETIDTLRTDYKARSWDSGTCGLHIHVSRKAFIDGRHTHRFIEFIYRNSEMMMKYGGRKSDYARFNDVWGFDEYDKPIFTLEGKSSGDDLHGGDKYTAVNTLKRDTLELRFIRGTMNVDSVKASLGLAHALVWYTRHSDDSRDNWYDWDSFVDWVTRGSEAYPELLERLANVRALSLQNLAKSKIDA